MSPATILIVDDYGPSRYGFRRILAPDGYEFLEAPDGETALRLILSGVALAIVDINLPDTSGFDLCKELRSVSPDLPVVLISASFRAAESHEGWPACGAAAFLEQPVDAAHLREVVRGLVKPD